MAARRRKRSGLRGVGWMGKKKTEFNKLSEYARDNGLHVSKYSPGDGVTRYRFFDKPGNTYFGPANGICTAMGLKAAWRYLQTGTCPRGKVR